MVGARPHDAPRSYTKVHCSRRRLLYFQVNFLSPTMGKISPTFFGLKEVSSVVSIAVIKISTQNIYYTLYCSGTTVKDMSI